MTKKIQYIFLPLLAAIFLTGCLKKEVAKPTTDLISETSESAIAVKDLPSGSYQADSAKSQINWFATKIISNAHPGLIDIKSGQLILDSGVLTGGEFVIDMNTMRDIDQTAGLIKHIKSADFFDVEKYPEAKFTITKAVLQGNHQNGSASYAINGDLTIKDTTKAIDFQAVLTVVDNELRGQARFSINRTDWGLNYGSGQFFKELGDKAIKDQIDYDIALVAKLNQ